MVDSPVGEWFNFYGKCIGKFTVRHMDGMGKGHGTPPHHTPQKLLQEGGDDFQQRALEAGSLEHLGQRNHGRWAPILVT